LWGWEGKPVGTKCPFSGCRLVVAQPRHTHAPALSLRARASPGRPVTGANVHALIHVVAQCMAVVWAVPVRHRWISPPRPGFCLVFVPDVVVFCGPSPSCAGWVQVQAPTKATRHEFEFITRPPKREPAPRVRDESSGCCASSPLLSEAHRVRGLQVHPPPRLIRCVTLDVAILWCAWLGVRGGAPTPRPVPRGCPSRTGTSPWLGSRTRLTQWARRRCCA
jgi:hypothetical protein